MTFEPVGVVLLNVGGPRTKEDVPAFIREMLSDPMVMPVPWPVRPLLARRISKRRRQNVIDHYRQVGLPSPVFEQTSLQAEALASELGEGFAVEHAFRYSSPTADECAARLEARGVRQIVALAGYPQWSRSTSGTALAELRRAATRRGLGVREIGSFPDAEGFIRALAALTRPLLTEGAHLLLCAHGLPQRTVERGDPYVMHVLRTAEALTAALGKDRPSSLAFQSRVGRMEWTRPYLTDEIARLGDGGTSAIVVVPVSFICENLETLFELDVETAELAREAGIASFRRAPAPGTHPDFIAGLAELVRKATAEAGWQVPRGN